MAPEILTSPQLTRCVLKTRVQNPENTFSESVKNYLTMLTSIGEKVAEDGAALEDPKSLSAVSCCKVL